MLSVDYDKFVSYIQRSIDKTNKITADLRSIHMEMSLEQNKKERSYFFVPGQLVRIPVSLLELELDNAIFQIKLCEN